MSSLIKRETGYCLSWYCAPGCPAHPGGARKHFVSLRTKDKRLAERYQKDKDLDLDKTHARVLLGLTSTTVATKQWTLKQFIQEYGDKVTREQLVSPVTWERSERYHLLTLLKFRPHAKLADVTEAWLAEYQAAVKSTVSPHSWKSRRGALRGVGKRAVSWGWLASNPFTSLATVNPKKKRPKRLQQEQLPIVVAAIPNPLWRLVTLFLYATGVRMGELCRLKREHVRPQQGYFEIETNKQNEPKVIALTPEIRAIIDEAHALDPSPYVFSRDKHPLHLEAVKNYYRWISKKVGFKVSPHRFRHSHGVHRMEAGDNLKAVSETLGHADIRTTANFYLDMNLSTQRVAMERLPIKSLMEIPTPPRQVGARSSSTESRLGKLLKKQA